MRLLQKSAARPESWCSASLIRAHMRNKAFIVELVTGVPGLDFARSRNRSTKEAASMIVFLQTYVIQRPIRREGQPYNFAATTIRVVRNAKKTLTGNLALHSSIRCADFVLRSGRSTSYDNNALGRAPLLHLGCPSNDMYIVVHRHNPTSTNLDLVDDDSTKRNIPRTPPPVVPFVRRRKRD